MRRNSTVEHIHGEFGKANLTLQDFKDHEMGKDRGRFALAQLATARFNYSSENRKYIRLDQLQTMKAVCSR